MASSITELPAVSYGAHRGGRNIAPENTMAAFRSAAAAGVDWLEMDVRALGDGTLVVFHDTTVDRVTTSSGPLSAMTAPAYATLRTIPGLPAPAWKGDPLPTVCEVLDELGGSMVMVMECKETSSIAPLAAMIRARALTDSVVISTHRPEDVPIIRGEGVRSHIWRGPEDGSPGDVQACAAAAPDILQVRYTWDDTMIGQYAAAVPATTLLWSDCSPRRVDRDRMISLGVAGIVSDDPVYLSGEAPQMSSTVWRWGTWGHGNVASDGVRPQIMADGMLALDWVGRAGLLVGDLSGFGDSYELEMPFILDAGPAGTPWVGLMVGAPDDTAWRDSNTDGSTGYLFLVNSFGNSHIYRKDSSGSTHLGSYNGVSLAVGVPYLMRVIITPASVSLEVPGHAPPVTVSDDTYRGPYMHVGANLDGVVVWNIGDITLV